MDPVPAQTVGICPHGRAGRCRGFTLVELLIVVALIAVVTALAFASLSTTSYAGTVDGFADRVSNTMETARLRATSSRRWQRLEFNGSTVTVWQSDTTGMGPVNAWQPLETIAVPAKVSVASTDTSTHVALGSGVPSPGDGLPGAVDFAPDGSAQSFTVFIQGEDGTRSRVIVYRATGASWVLKDW